VNQKQSGALVFRGHAAPPMAARRGNHALQRYLPLKHRYDPSRTAVALGSGDGVHQFPSLRAQRVQIVFKRALIDLPSQETLRVGEQRLIFHSIHAFSLLRRSSLSISPQRFHTLNIQRNAYVGKRYVPATNGAAAKPLPFNHIFIIGGAGDDALDVIYHRAPLPLLCQTRLLRHAPRPKQVGRFVTDIRNANRLHALQDCGDDAPIPCDQKMRGDNAAAEEQTACIQPPPSDVVEVFIRTNKNKFANPYQ
jgi:hypothetical protein